MYSTSRDKNDDRLKFRDKEGRKEKRTESARGNLSERNRDANSNGEWNWRNKFQGRSSRKKYRISTYSDASHKLARYFHRFIKLPT
jgi:hypothetical protein